ncbi:MAG: succinate dehydrogenase, hydrophobic membrane anchor protein [Candidatus Tectomicrobia bacterium]|uniref:Succinate dehydrogenase hydrophobic membrane anchor subunit n=1 Tax=Tectimicrobiota bacterium TaxID=2528274 RepID=A0A933GJY0_UNCTE|nr:succinate dehydrogenase, hydrophobic membrane anchor protein [Candidatus Tectomicrobia bacterium]
MLPYRGSNRSGGALAWYFQRISGGIIVLLFLAHFWVLHFTIGGEITYLKVAARLASPFWKTLDMIFLVLALYHGFNGIYSIVVDYIDSDLWRNTIFGLLAFLGLILFILGATSILPFAPKV